MKERLLAALDDYIGKEAISIEIAEDLKNAPPAEAQAAWERSMEATIGANRAMKRVFERLAEYVEGLP